MGTDAGYPPLEFNSVIEEIISLVSVGATPLQAIRYATKISAGACGLGHRYGELLKGKNASMAIFSENPLINIEVLRNVKIIIRDGL